VQIQEIERTLSARLFVRTKRAVALTPAGEIFLGEARNVVGQFARAESAGRRAGRGEIGRVEIGYVGSAAYAGVLQDQMKRFSDSWPAVHFNACEFPMGELPKLIAEGQVDVGFVRLPTTLPRSLRLHILLCDQFCLALPSAHRHAADSGPLQSRRLAGEAFIAPEQQAGTYEVGRRGRFAPRIVSSPGNLLAVLTQVSLGAGIAVVPSVVREVVHLPNVTFRLISGEPIVSEVAAVFRSDESSPTVRNFVDQIRASPSA
jgi:DNA-binding transcriptional LysR family regulator